MKKLIVFLALGSLIQLSFAQNQKENQLVMEIAKLLSENFKSNEPGGTVLVARKGEIIYSGAWGMADLELEVSMQEEHVFRIASITKQFTAVAILQLMEQGKLKLDDEITKYLPDYPAQGNKLTIEHLLTHTSGISNATSLPEQMLQVDQTPTDFINAFRDQPLLFVPGTGYFYSNNGYFLLGYIIEKLSGKTYGDYLEEHIFRPLDMKNSLYANDTKIVKNRATGYSWGEEGFEHPQPLSMSIPFSAGAIQSTVGDLYKWNQAIHSGKVLKKESLDMAFRRFELNDGTKTDYGYGWKLGHVYDSPSIWHAGLINGFMSMAIYLPEEEVFVAVLSNCECNSPQPVALKLAALAAGKISELKEISPEAEDLQRFSGVYENDQGQQRIFRVEDRKLLTQVGRGPKSALKASRKNSFFLDEESQVIFEFSEDSEGEIDALTTMAPEGMEIWSRTEKLIPSENGIKVAEQVLQAYVGEYEMNPDFRFVISKEADRMFVQASGQEKLELFAETESRFFVKVNDAEFEFVKDEGGKVSKVHLNQGGRQAEATKVK